MTGPFEFTPAVKMKAVSRNLFLKWVKQSWAEIPAEMVRKSFKTCGISNALDGSEDDKVYADDMPELADDDMAMEDEFETDSEEDYEWKLHSWSQQNKTAPWIKVYDQQQWFSYANYRVVDNCLAYDSRI